MIRPRTSTRANLAGSLVSLVSLACGSPGSDAGTTTGTTTTTTATTTGTGGAGTGSSGDGSTAAVLDTGTSSSSTGVDGSDSGSDTGPVVPPPKSCALAVIDPTADVEAAVDEGDGPDQIPTVVGDVLVRNCGCHYTDNVQVGQYVDYKSNKQPLATLADFHGNFMGTFPQGYADMPTYLAVEQRVVFHHPLPMPSLGCGVVGEPGLISADDLTTLTEWLAAAAPDGASWP